MNIHDATEQAYKNGYEQGIKDALHVALQAVIRCKDCANSDNISCSKGMVWCNRICRYMKEDGFCSFGERKGTKDGK